MALINRAWRESTYVPPGAEPGLTSNRPYFQNVQDQAVGAIARTRFAFPSKEFESWKTYVNRPEHTCGVRVASGDLLFPDIVVINTLTTEVEMLAEVETDRSLRDPDVTEKWKAFTTAGPLYLYVPLTYAGRAKRMAKDAGVRLRGIRGWKLNMGQQTADIVELPG